jgi:hypothetical protein
MFKNKFSLTLKLFIIVWIVLFVHILLKLTFNYWQPYVIPNEQLQIISDFIDRNRWLQVSLNSIFYIFNGVVMFLTAVKQWWFKNIKQAILIISLIIINFIITVIFPDFVIGTLLIVIIIPMILDFRKWYFAIGAFALSNVFLALSLWLEGFISANNTNYIIAMFLLLDYYIMLFLNYFVFNLIKIKKVK